MELVGGPVDDLPGTAHAASGLCAAILGGGGQLEQVVAALRILGVFSCALRGVTRCPCWNDLVRHDGFDAAKNELAGGLQGQLAG